MAFKFIRRFQQSINSRRAARKRMRRPTFEKEESSSKIQDHGQGIQSFSTESTEKEIPDSSPANEQIQEPSIPLSADNVPVDEAKTKQANDSTKIKPDPTDVDDIDIDAIIKEIEKEEKAQANAKNQAAKIEEKAPTTKNELHRAASRPDSTIIVIYQDENHQTLSSPEIISGKRGEPINFKFKEFNHFDLINIAGFTSTFVEPYGSITLTYRRQSGANIWLFSQDIDDLHMLGKPRFVNGKIDEKYALTPPDFIGYNLLRAKGPVKGNFHEKQQVVTYYYRDATWKEVNFNVKYLKMKESQPGYDSPRGKDTYITLAEGTVWQVFESVHLTNGERWHCLGGSLWIKEDYDKVKFVDSLPQYAIGSQNGYQFSINLNIQAIIDFVPGKKLTLYDRPFGSPVDSIEDGSIVTITERQGGREMQWFKIDDRGWTIRQYLDMDIEHKVAQEQGRL